MLSGRCGGWKALREQGIEEPYMQPLTKLYDQQRATAHTDDRSKQFHLKRGTKQGDPLSTLLSNSLSQYIMKRPTEKWNRGKHGVRLVEHDPGQ